MIGIDRNTGQLIDGIAHLRQSLQDLLTTPKGSRLMRGDYGSNVPRLVDMPVNSELVIDLISETAGAIIEWEPRLQVSNVQVTTITSSSIVLAISGKYLPDGQDVTLDGIVVK